MLPKREATASQRSSVAWYRSTWPRCAATITRWAIEVALAGGHNLLMVGAPGAGKTLLARTIPGLLPPLSEAEALEVTVIESVAGLLDMEAGPPRRPFRAPHHTSSSAALVGGGPWLLPGEVTLATCGVLFLDELPEFDRDALDALRQPLEEGVVTIARAHGHVRTRPASSWWRR